MLQEIIAFSLFIIAIIYTLYSILRLFIPGKNHSSSSCPGCGGACGMKSKLKTSYKLEIQALREK